MGSEKYDIFISYRREGGADTAKHLRDVLTGRGYRVFFDTDSLRSGDFNRELLKVIEQCTDFIIILSSGALDRCVNKDDWVRQELAYALKKEKNVIPILSGQFSFPESLPKDIDDVRWKNGIKVNIEYFEAMVEKLVSFLHSQPKKRFPSRRFFPMAVGCVLALAAVIGIAVFVPKVSNTGMNDSVQNAGDQAVNVYCSEVIPYTKAGYYESYDDLSLQVENKIEVAEAFSILSFVRNYGEHNAVVEKVSCEILDLQPITEPVLIGSAAIKDNILKLFIMNDGWGNAENIEVICTVTPNSFGSVEGAFEKKHTIDTIDAGEIVLAVEYRLDDAKLKQWMNQNSVADDMYSGMYIYSLVFEFRTGKHTGSVSYSLSYSPETNMFSLSQDIGDGDGEEEYSVTLFGILDVDNNPSAITFTGPSAAPVIQDTFRIETVIAPTKSCIVTCKDLYSINGEIQETDPCIITVTVPQFVPGHFGDIGGELLDKLMNANTADPMILADVYEPYKYDPETIILSASNNSGLGG